MAETPPARPTAQPTAQIEAVGRGTVWSLTLAGLTGLAAAFVLLVEKIALLTDPTYVPSCSINPVLSCGSVMNTDQAAAFGFLNPILGVAGFTALLTVGVVLMARVSLPGWFWWGIQAGTTFGVVFVHWLAAITAFAAATAHNVRTGRLPVPARLRGIASYGPIVVTVWLVVIAGLIVIQFWDYWVTLGN
jgi:uncharacterized membrane protein